MEDADRDRMRLVVDYLLGLMVDSNHLLDRHQRVDVVDPDPETLSALKDLKGDELWERLEALGHDEAISELTRRSVAAAVTSEMLQFLYAARDALDVGRVTVAYTLLRKPLRECLTTLEWLLVDPAGFTAGLADLDPGACEPTKLSMERRRELVDKALSATGQTAALADLIFDVRNLRQAPGLAGYFDQAVHLVTSRRQIRTEPNNLNFVFADAEVRQEHIDYLWFILPHLLLYASDVVEHLAMANAARLDEAEEVRTWRRVVYLGLTTMWNDADGLSELLAPLMPPDNQVSCTDCGETIEVEPEYLVLSLMQRRFACPSCGYEAPFPIATVWRDGATGEDEPHATHRHNNS